jgi:hypothetical protein
MFSPLHCSMITSAISFCQVHCDGNQKSLPGVFMPLTLTHLPHVSVKHVTAKHVSATHVFAPPPARVFPPFWRKKARSFTPLSVAMARFFTAGAGKVVYKSVKKAPLSCVSPAWLLRSFARRGKQCGRHRVCSYQRLL